MRIWTVGHSTRKLQELVEMLKANKIEILVDIRTIPKSRFNPQFNTDQLAEQLSRENVAYLHFPGLGGLRHPQKNSLNEGWRNKGFRGFADYMQTDAFRQALNELIAIAKERRTAIMCAEAVHWRCHRSLVSDALLVHDFEVLHIQSEKKTEPHRLTPFAQVEGRRITYPSEQPRLL